MTLTLTEAQWLDSIVTRLGNRKRSTQTHKRSTREDNTIIFEFLEKVKLYVNTCTGYLNHQLAHSPERIRFHVLDLRHPRKGFLILRGKDKLIVESVQESIVLRASTYENRKIKSKLVCCLRFERRGARPPLWKDSQSQRLTWESLVHDHIGQFFDLGYSSYGKVEGASRKEGNSSISLSEQGVERTSL